MTKDRTNNYNNLTEAPYNSLLNRESDLTYSFGEQTLKGNESQGTSGFLGERSDNGTTQTKGGSVATVSLKSEGNASDIWILNFIRSTNWKPKKVGFTINGATGYAEFSNMYVAGAINATSGYIGGFEIGSDYLRDVANTMGLASTVSIDDDVRFWAGETYENRAIAPYRVLESGLMVVSNIVISGGTIEGTTIASDSGIGAPTTTPTVIGQLYIDVDTNPITERVYISIGTTGAEDWIILVSTGVTRNIDISDSITVSETLEFETLGMSPSSSLSPSASISPSSSVSPSASLSPSASVSPSSSVSSSTSPSASVSPSSSISPSSSVSPSTP